MKRMCKKRIFLRRDNQQQQQKQQIVSAYESVGTQGTDRTIITCKV